MKLSKETLQILQAEKATIKHKLTSEDEELTKEENFLTFIYGLKDDLTDYQKIYFSNLLFLNNPKNSKYIKLLILLLQRPDKSIYEKCKEYYDIFTKKNPLDSVMYKRAKIDSFKHNNKLYPLLELLEKRNILANIKIENSNEYYPYFIIAPYRIDFSIINKEKKYLKSENDESVMPIAHTVITFKRFDKILVNQFNYLITKININPLPRLLTLTKFDFSSFISTWLHIVQDVKRVKEILDNNSDKKQTEIEQTLKYSLIEDINLKDTEEQIKLINKEELEEYIIFLKDHIVSLSELERIAPELILAPEKDTTTAKHINK